MESPVPEGRAVRTFATHLSRTVTVTANYAIYRNRSLIPQTTTEVVVLRQVALHSGGESIEAFHPSCKQPSNGWERTKECVLQAIDRYPRVNAIRLLFEVHAQVQWGGDVFIDLVTEDGYTFRNQTMERRGTQCDINLYFGAPDDDSTPGGNSTPKDLCDAIDKHDITAVQSVVASGVSVNSAVGCGSVLAAAINMADDTEGADAARAVLGWIVSRPDIDWQKRAYMGAPILHQLHGNALYILQDVLPWDQIDIHACDDQGDNIIHQCAKTMRNAKGWLSPLIAMLLRRGSGTLVLCVNDAGDRPSKFAEESLWAQLYQAEKKTMPVVTANLSAVIAVADVVGLVLQYYTSVIPIK
jgi:hypothetical protein